MAQTVFSAPRGSARAAILEDFVASTLGSRDENVSIDRTGTNGTTLRVHVKDDDPYTETTSALRACLTLVGMR